MAVLYLVNKYHFIEHMNDYPAGDESSNDWSPAWFIRSFLFFPLTFFVLKNLTYWYIRIEEESHNQQTEKPFGYLPVNQHLIIPIYSVLL